MNKNARKIAVDVLKATMGMDHRMMARHDKLSEIADAWALVFDGRVWPDEAIAAVVEHYSRANAFPIMPGDVVAFCERQPVWSSREHATDFVKSMRQYPHTPLVEHYSGLRPPAPDEFDNWMAANHEQIVSAILRKKNRPPVS